MRPIDTIKRAKTMQEPCEDAISRNAMLDYQKYLHGKMSNEENYKLWEFIKDSPSVTPTQKWIPCSERLPEDRREVLVTAYWHEAYQVMMASYFGDGLWWCVPFNNSGEHTQRLKPKAWMPLPKPYKAESEGDE